jgi:hypothetical protein
MVKVKYSNGFNLYLSEFGKGIDEQDNFRDITYIEMILNGKNEEFKLLHQHISEDKTSLFLYFKKNWYRYIEFKLHIVDQSGFIDWAGFIPPLKYELLYIKEIKKISYKSVKMFDSIENRIGDLIYVLLLLFIFVCFWGIVILFQSSTSMQNAESLTLCIMSIYLFSEWLNKPKK